METQVYEVVVRKKEYIVYGEDFVTKTITAYYMTRMEAEFIKHANPSGTVDIHEIPCILYKDEYFTKIPFVFSTVFGPDFAAFKVVKLKEQSEAAQLEIKKQNAMSKLTPEERKLLFG